ncbi:MAG: coproporphyrinogen dehydrogenase HemZ, partial [Lachnospiraceae bacterium]|nr:coproporphyrinogen dehydrogenase HemZ [Lachnospiraceae bacterium]
MINVYTNRENYQYDLHALLKSFYPEHEVRVYNESAKNNQKDSDSQVFIRLLDDRMELVLDIDDRKEYTHTYQNDGGATKNDYKLSLYYDLCDYTGKTLPWGNLTGIRPTKLTMGMLEEGLKDAEIIAQMKETHAVSDEKAWLSLDIARREKQILDSIHYEDGYSMYIGIPFCPTTCLYCSFTSYPIAIWRKRIQEYLQALFKEIDYVSAAYKNMSLIHILL